MTDADLIVVGAGPTGMAAAAVAAKGGARVLVLDEQAQAGGQIFRNVGKSARERNYLGKDYTAGRPLVEALRTPGIVAEFGATVWRIDDGPQVTWSRDGQSRITTARHLLLACGAQERPMPFPGWTLPGVMPAGAAQILMKTAGLLPRDAVLAGSGPLLYLVAAQLVDAGAPPRAVVETQTPAMIVRALHHLPRAVLAAPTLAKGLSLIRKIAAAGVTRHKAASGFSATALDTGEIAFRFKSKGRIQELATSILLTHQGVVPATHISRAAGITHHWNAAQFAIEPVTDDWGATDVEGIHVAGDGAGVGGADAAQAAGRLAAYDILHKLGYISADARNQKASGDRGALKRALALRPFLDAAYAPLAEFLAPEGETIVCRCEEISAARICATVAKGASGLRQVKTSTRAGMGPCQGRMCELTVRGILSSCGANPALPRVRSPVKPVKLGELAALETPQER